MRTLVLALLLSGCHNKPSVDPAELDKLRAEQREMHAKIAALQARIDEQAKGKPVAPAPPIQPAAAPLPRPLLTNINTAENGAVVTTSAPRTTEVAPVVAASPPTPSAPSTLRTEDLHGDPIGSSPLGSPSTTGASAPADAESAALLQQLQTQMQALQKNQAASQTALDQLEKER